MRTQILLYSFDDVNFIKKRAIDDSWPNYMKVFMNNVLEGDAESRWASTEGREFFRDKMKQEVSLLPNILDQVSTGSPGNSSIGDGNSPFFSQLKSSLSSNWSTGEDTLTGKIVKNRLRMKLKQSCSSQPYTITERRGPQEGHGHTRSIARFQHAHVIRDTLTTKKLLIKFGWSVIADQLQFVFLVLMFV
ncbi:uncharacterized protein LOC121381641 [Gigantopelta aegis]|uniref:uncharacterized protein LOC121381641 n=1 Tax=Gigantopelta aegis TaxID=1735272 RepID=UPI001B887C06|nr:uncharacterized protein LOC121381641 [Gigantopelta aegis]